MSVLLFVSRFDFFSIPFPPLLPSFPCLTCDRFTTTTDTMNNNDGFTSTILPKERAGASFDIAKLTYAINRNHSKIIEKFAPLFDEELFRSKEDDVNLSYEDGFRKSIERVTRAFEIVRSNPDFMVAHMRQKIQMQQFFDHNGVFVHFTMVMNYMFSHADKAQKRYWLTKAREGDFVAAYAQTELGHGSNVRGLETTATFDRSTQEWEIHSPTLTSLKWWPTGMYACTHALVYAQLVIGGETKGLNAFMVQLRKADGTLMPGVELGEIGPKMNTTSSNIGYCRFTRVRIPKDWLFSKYSKVSPEGQYAPVPKKLSKFKYISMMLSRVAIMTIAYDMCARAATIAIRYSAVRRQGFKPGQTTPGEGEHFIIDYKMQQYRIFRACAFSYCLLWNSRYISGYIKRVQTAINDGDMAAADDLPELHATLSGLKATATVQAHDCIEECRKCCGGQGFLMSSGIAKLSPDFSEWVTVEGEQVILSLQCARFLIKAVHTAKEGKAMTATIAYIGESDRPFDPSSPAGIIEALKLRARHLAKRLTEQFDSLRARGMNFDDALNRCAMLAIKAANAHVQKFMYENNEIAIEQFFKKQDTPAINTVMRRLLRLYGLQTITENAGDFIGLSMTVPLAAFMESVDRRITVLLDEIRPDAVPLVDSFGFLDSQLQSTLGRYDGNVYEAIYNDAAKKNPLNSLPNGKMIGWDTYKSILDLDFIQETEKKQRQRATGKL